MTALTPIQIMAVPCSTCGAGRNEPCEPASSHPHREREWAASDKRLSHEVNQAATPHGT